MDVSTDEAVAPEVESPQEPEKSNSYWWLLISVAVFVVASIANYEIKLPYYVLSPGSAVPAKTFVQVDPNHAHPQSGKLLLATVGLTQAHPIDWAVAHVMPGDDIDSKADVLGPKTTPTQYTQENAAALDDSQQVAIEVAMTRAGYSVKPLGDGAQVAAIAKNAPAAGKLNVNDVIAQVNSQPISTASEAVTAVQGSKVGEVVHLQVRDQKKQTRSVDITLGARPDTGAPYIGVALQTANPHLQTPFPVGFKSTDFGGPSAGLAFTLTLLDELTPGQLTGGQTVATTGTINADGTVGPVGGVKQKTHAVEAAGAKIFIVPTDEYADAKKAANKSLTVIPVDTLDEAISALATHGGDASGIPAAPVA